MTTIVVVPRGKFKALCEPLTFGVPQTLTYECHSPISIGQLTATLYTYRCRGTAGGTTVAGPRHHAVTSYEYRL
jgi:hypothetical protein